jgi:hypothetical protein
MGCLLLRNRRSDSSTERGRLGKHAHSTALAPHVKRKHATHMTTYAFSDHAVRHRRLLAILQACALNTRGHLQSAATDGNREAQRSSAGLTCLWPDASSGA